MKKDDDILRMVRSYRTPLRAGCRTVHGFKPYHKFSAGQNWYLLDLGFGHQDEVDVTRIPGCGQTYRIQTSDILRLEDADIVLKWSAIQKFF